MLNLYKVYGGTAIKLYSTFLYNTTNLLMSVSS